MNSMFTRIVRIVLGLALVVFGANMMAHFIPMDQPDTNTAAGQFMNSLGATGYIFPIVLRIFAETVGRVGAGFQL